jgi:hypothetical protein
MTSMKTSPPAAVLRPDVAVSRPDAETAKLGDRFTATTIADLYNGEVLLVPAGSSVRGIVTGVAKAGRVGRTGRLALSFDRVTVKGQAYPIHGTSPRRCSSYDWASRQYDVTVHENPRVTSPTNQQARIAGEEARFAAEAARNATMESLHTTAESLEAMLDGMRVMECGGPFATSATGTRWTPTSPGG